MPGWCSPAGCAKGTTPSSSGGAGGEIDQNAPVTITIGDRPTPDKPNDLKAFDQKIKDFTAKNPNITVKSTETSWQAQTFQAQVAGGTLPTVMNISFTEPANMIPNKQLPDITDELKLVDLTKDLNPNVLKIVQDANGRIYGVPIDVVLGRHRLQPGAVHAGRPGPGQAADDLGRGPPVREADPPTRPARPGTRS